MAKKNIVLGTANFGLDYGINNKTGRLPSEEAKSILDFAVDNGIKTMDTAAAYGDSEKVLGRYMASSGRALDIITKITSPTPAGLRESFMSSLERLGQSRIEGCLLHAFSDYKKNPGIYDELLKLKKEGLVRKTGFSLYYPSEAESIMDSGSPFDIIQAPYNVLDTRFAASFARARRAGAEVHVRSLFLQGLLFVEPENLRGRFTQIKDNIRKLREIAVGTDSPLEAVCLNFAALNPDIDSLVVGVDGVEHLRRLAAAGSHYAKIFAAKNEISSLAVADENITVPARWN